MHVVVKILLFIATCIQWYVCYAIAVPIGSNLWEHNACTEGNNMGMYEGHMGHDASTKDPSYVSITRVPERAWQE